MARRYNNVFKTHHNRDLRRFLGQPVGLALCAGLLVGVGLILFGYVLPRTTPSLKQRPSVSTTTNPLHDKHLYVDMPSNASQQADKWRTARPADAALMDKLAALPTARWINDDTTLVQVSSIVQTAQTQHQLPVTVVYNLPKRDCGLYSAGGAASPEQYKAFIDRYAAALDKAEAVVIIEPDALPQLLDSAENKQPCLNAAEQQTRYQLLNYAVETLGKLPGIITYIDAGNSEWIDASQVAAGLTKAGIAKADGFSLNVSNFIPTDQTIRYGTAISSKLRNAHFVMDTSRSGLGAYKNAAQPDFGWCNPPGRALGHYPTTSTNNPLVDAFLYIKYPGESDGADPDTTKCFGGPKAGVWWPEYALGLLRRWPDSQQPTR